MNNQERKLAMMADDDIQEEEIIVYTCHYCGWQCYDDSSNLSPSSFNIGDRNTMYEHLIEEHKEELEEDYSSDEDEEDG